MRIAKVWNNRYPWDVRVEKVTHALAADGHEVHLVCNDGVDREIASSIPGLRLHLTPSLRHRIVQSLVTAPIFLNPFWLLTLWRVVMRERIEAILVRDLPLVLVGIIVGRLRGIPVVFDMAENYPAMWRELTNRSGVNVVNYVLRNPWIAERLESYVTRRVDHVLVVIEESRDRITANGADPERISVVGNTPILDHGTATDRKDGLPRSLDGRFTLMYTGFVDNCRGIATAIRGLALLRDEIPEVMLVVAGGGDESLLASHRELAKELGVAEHTYFTGWLPHAAIPSYIRRGDICIVPHDSTEMVNSTIPNKLFDYMHTGKAVLVSDARPLERIVESAGCGLVFGAGDPESFRAKVLELRDPELRRALGERGKAAVNNRFNWGHDARVLVDVFNRLDDRAATSALTDS